MDCGWAGNEIPMRESAKGIQLYHELADEVRPEPPRSYPQPSLNFAGVAVWRVAGGTRCARLTRRVS